MSSPRVLASQLPSHDGRSVTLLGLAASASADASTAVFTAADGKQVAVSLGPAAHASALVVGMPYDVVGVVQQGRINAVGTDCCRVPQSSRKRSCRFILRLLSLAHPSILTLSSCVAASVLRTTTCGPRPADKRILGPHAARHGPLRVRGHSVFQLPLPILKESIVVTPYALPACTAARLGDDARHMPKRARRNQLARCRLGQKAGVAMKV